MEMVVIGIAGGSASGKTTVAKKIVAKSFPNDSVTLIRIDDYYKPLGHLSMEERKKINFDHPDAFDFDLLITHIQLLKEGKTILKPTYDFTLHDRSDQSEVINPCSVLVIEGIFALWEERLRSLFNIKLFVDTPADIRFIRRLKRDTESRGRSMDSVINQYLTTVRPMHLLFVEPSKEYADLIIPEGGNNTIAIDLIASKISGLLEQ
jgi:uridine kinase